MNVIIAAILLPGVWADMIDAQMVFKESFRDIEPLTTDPSRDSIERVLVQEGKNSIEELADGDGRGTRTRLSVGGGRGSGGGFRPRR